MLDKEYFWYEATSEPYQFFFTRELMFRKNFDGILVDWNNYIFCVFVYYLNIFIIQSNVKTTFACRRSTVTLK